LRNYEGMFLFDPTVSNEWESIEAELMRLMGRVDARVITCDKWDERRLAYPVRGQKRGIYVLVFFEIDPNRLGELERDVQLSEQVMRCLVQKADYLSEKEMKEIASRPPDHSAIEADRITGRWSAVEATTGKGASSESGNKEGGEKAAGGQTETATDKIDPPKSPDGDK